MGNFLASKFIKDFENVNDPKVRQAYGKFAGIVGILSNVLLCTMKILVGVLSNSIAIIADGINNLADASSSLITLIGFKLASLPEDDDHPYGHARIEYLTGLLVSVLIIIVGFELLTSSIDKILHPDEFAFSITTIVVLAVAIAIKIWQALFNISLGKKINSVALIATGTDSRNDVISTSAVLVSVLIGYFADLQLDGYMGCLVAAFIMWSGISLVRETISPLLGEAPDPQLVDDIERLVTGFDGVLGIHDLVVHNYGPGKIFASVHIEVDAKGDIMESHDMIDVIEYTARKELSIELVGHMDPIETDNPVLNMVKEKLHGYIKDMEGVLNLHDFRIVPGPTHTNFIFDLVLAASCKMTQNEIKQKLQEYVFTIDPTYLLVINFDKNYVKIDK